MAEWKRPGGVRARVYKSGDNATVSLRMPESLKKQLDKLAADYGRTFSDLCCEGLDQFAEFLAKSAKLKGD